jgi:hypothetical protein
LQQAQRSHEVGLQSAKRLRLKLVDVLERGGMKNNIRGVIGKGLFQRFLLQDIGMNELDLWQGDVSLPVIPVEKAQIVCRTIKQYQLSGMAAHHQVGKIRSDRSSGPSYQNGLIGDKLLPIQAA